MEEFKGYFDKYGLLHVKEGEYSENGILFLAEYALLKSLNLGYNDIRGKWLLAAEATTYKGFFDPNPNHDNTYSVHFSHDNMTGLYCILSNMNLSVKNLPTIFWNGSVNLHPRDVLFYTILKNKFLGMFLVPLLFPFLYVSCLSKPYRTSGKCLWFLRLHTLNFIYNNILTDYLIKIMYSFLEEDHGPSPFLDIFQIYFKEKNHPINEEAREYFKEDVI